MLRRCGTGVVNQLYKARKDFDKGLPLSENVIVDEVEMLVFDEWTKVGRKHTRTENEDVVEDIITPRIEIVGENRDVQLLSPDEIHGFLPLHGHEYRLLVRRFQIRNSSFDNAQYDLIRVISDTIRTGM